MKTPGVAFLLVLGLASTPLSAELKYTVRVEARKAAVPAEVDPMLAMMGTEMLDAIVPDGPVELTVILGAGVARVEWDKALPGIPAGAILLQRANGQRVMINPADRTYWRVQVPNLYAMQAARRPVVTSTPGTETATIAGVPATVSLVTISIPFPEARAGLLVSGTPTELPLEGQVWITDAFAAHLTPAFRPILGLAILGFDVAPVGKLVLRQVLRGPLFGDLELESVVTTIAEQDLPDTLFEVPADFKEIPAPRVVGG